MKLLSGLLLKPTLNLLSWLLRRNGNSVIIGGPLGWSWEPNIDPTHHGSLVGPANAHRHSDLANIGIDDHHAQDHAARHQDGGADEMNIAGLSGEPTELTTHKGLESAHHTKFTTTEHDVVARHPLSVLDSAVCSETEADGKITAHAGVAGAHHAPKKTATGGYTGNGADDRQITTGFKCSCVIIQNTDKANSRAVIIPNMALIDGSATDNKEETAKHYFHATDGFVVSCTWSDVDLNFNGSEYYFWAISE